MVPITGTALPARRTLLALSAVVVLAGCGPTVVVLKDPVSGAVAQCKGCEASGYKRMSRY